MNEELHLEHERDELNDVDLPEASYEIEVSDLGHSLSPQLIESEGSDEEDSPIRAMEAILVKARESLKRRGKGKNTGSLKKKNPVLKERGAERDNKVKGYGEKVSDKKIDRERTRWNVNNTNTLIDMMEDRPCLRDVSKVEYTLREGRVKALNEIEDVLGFPENEIKNKLTSLRSQLGRELSKMAKTKSGQSADEL